jgi:hypothetical protein
VRSNNRHIGRAKCLAPASAVLEMLRTYLLAVAKCTTLVWLAVVGAADTGHAANRCDLRLLPDPPDTNAYEQWILSGQNERCEAKRLVTSIAGCTLWLDYEHGRQGFSCEKLKIGGYWGSRSDADDAANIAAARERGLPEHRELRGAWLAPVDTEYLYKGHPIDDEDSFERYPRRFTKIGAKIARPNPFFRVTTQSLHYFRADGEERAAVTGEAALGCLKVFFISWVAPSAAKEAEERLSVFLQDLRMEPVKLTDKQRNHLCSTSYKK